MSISTLERPDTEALPVLHLLAEDVTSFEYKTVDEALARQSPPVTMEMAMKFMGEVKRQPLPKSLFQVDPFELVDQPAAWTWAEVVDVVRQAAEVIERVGWIRQALVNTAGSVCAIGAINQVATGDARQGPDAGLGESLHEGTIRAFSQWLGGVAVPKWNDAHGGEECTCCKGVHIRFTRPAPTCGADVVKAFRDFADELELANA